MSNLGVKQAVTYRFNGENIREADDVLAVEEPLEISIKKPNEKQNKVSITMRTPGNDFELALGFLFTEGIIRNYTEIEKVSHTQTLPGVESNTLLVELSLESQYDPTKLNRNFYTTSSCGVCGKASIDAIKTVSEFSNSEKPFYLSTNIITGLPQKLRGAQETFNATGGLHACAAFDNEGKLIILREDVGRHNALDKLVGQLFQTNRLPAADFVLLLSGRASFELLQKASMAGFQMVCAVGAPSSLAVQTAEELGITLVGFLSAQRFNIYTFPNRVIL